MTEQLQAWIEEYKLDLQPLVQENAALDMYHIPDVGSFLYIKPHDGNIIGGDFSFVLSDKEFDALEKKVADFVLFEFGGKFYYSGVKPDKNKYNENIFKPEFKDFKYLGKCTEPFITDYVHLGVHSEYEILNGSGHCDLWCKKSRFLGIHTLGICDKNTLAAALSFQSACVAANIKPVIGETVTIAIDFDPKKPAQETFELKLYVLNDEGWKNLLLVNKAIRVDYLGFIPDEELYKLGKGLCCVIPPDSEFNSIIDDTIKAKRLLRKYRSAFDKVYYQIDTVEYVSQQLYREHLHNIDTYVCNYGGTLKPILINDSYYLDKEMHELKKMLNKVAGKAYPESENQYFKSLGDTIQDFSEWIDQAPVLFAIMMAGVENAVKLVKGINFVIPTGDRKLPRYPVKNCEKLFYKELERGITERLKDKTDEELKVYLERLETECNVIVPNDLCDYFMILWDMRKWCRENGILGGPGRGSACGSLVAYLLYITDVDPIKYGTLFERFLNETRVKVPEMWELEFENGEKIKIPLDKPVPLTDGTEIVITEETERSKLQNVDFEYLKASL